MVAALRIKLLGQQLVSRQRKTASEEAYNQYLLGRQLSGRMTLDGTHRAMVAFERAVVLDPGYAPAWAGLGRARFWNLALTGEGLDAASEAVERAIALGP